MILKKLMPYLTNTLLMSVPIFAVRVVETTATEQTNPASQGLAITILTIFIMSMFGLILLLGFGFAVFKIWTWLTDYQRNKDDFIYSVYQNDLLQCQVNADKEMKWRNWKFLWLLYKRRPVYANTSSGLRVLGFYDGEADKKENFKIIALYNQIGFKMIDKIILIPNGIKYIVKKEMIDGTKVMIIECEEIDQVENTDYYFMPLLKDTKDNTKYLDFSDMIHSEYIEKIIHRDIIKENLQSYREGIIKSVESNPRVHFKRRTQAGGNNK